MKSELNFLSFLNAEMAKELSRKQRQHGGHRSSATRIILSAIEVLATGDVSQFAKHTVKLNQQRASLQQKQITLRQLDMEILPILGEDEIESEIERVDLVKENIQLAIANINNALSSNANANTVVSNPSEQSPVQPSTVSKRIDRRRSWRAWFISSESYIGGFLSLFTGENPGQTTEVGTKEI